jgi:hypothetical protein
MGGWPGIAFLAVYPTYTGKISVTASHPVAGSGFSGTGTPACAL